MSDPLGSAIINDGAICYASLNDPRYPELATGVASYWPNYTSHTSGPSLPYHTPKMMYSENNTATTPFAHFDFGIAYQKVASGVHTLECVFMTDVCNFDFGGSHWAHPIFVIYTDWAAFAINVSEKDGAAKNPSDGVIGVNAFFFGTTYFNSRDTTIVNDGNIYHLIVEISNPASSGSGYVKIYIDGKLTLTATPLNAGGLNYIRGFGVGRPPSDGLSTWTGYVGHVAFYTKALTAAQKSSHAALTKLTYPPKTMYFDSTSNVWLPASGITKFNIDGTWSNKDTTRLL